jgi:hypothetical protein
MFINFYHSFYYSILIASALTALVLFRGLDTVFKWLAILLFATLLSELIAKYISFSLRKSNNPVYHIFTIIEYILYAFIYSYFFSTKKYRSFLIISAWGLLGLEIINVLFFQNLQTDNTNTMMLESLLLIFLSLTLFMEIKNSLKYKNIFQEGIFWFNCAVLFYYSFSVLIWGLHGLKIYELKDQPMVVYDLILLLSGLLYLFYSFSIVLNFRSHKALNKNV